MKKKIAKNSFPKTKIEKSNFNFNTTLPVTVVFFITALFGIINHEMWRDELQPWLCIRDAHSLNEFFVNVDYEGHPFLWYLLLFPVSAISDNPFAMQFFHLLIATGYIYLFNKFSPFSWWNKILFSFGYFTLYEYGIFSSCYGLGVLLVMWICTLYSHRIKNIIPISILLLLLANTSPYGVVLSIGFAVLIFFDIVFYRDEWKIVSFKKIASGSLIFFGGLSLAFYYIIPHKDTSGSYPMYEQFSNPDYLKLVFSKIYNAYFLVPEMDTLSNGWSVTGLENYQKDITDLLLQHFFIAFLLFISILILLIRKPAALLFYLGSTAGLLLMLCVSPRLSCRYTGHLFIIMIAALWVFRYFQMKKTSFSFYNKLVNMFNPISKILDKGLITVVLIFHTYVGIKTYLNDSKKVFSASREAGKYILDQKLDSLPVIGAVDYALAPISAYIYKPIYYPQRKEYGSFIIWDGKRNPGFQWDDIVQSVDTILGNKNKKMLIVLNFQPQYTANNQIIKLTEGTLSTNIKVNLLKAFENGIIPDEKYYIYLAERI